MHKRKAARPSDPEAGSDPANHCSHYREFDELERLGCSEMRESCHHTYLPCETAPIPVRGGSLLAFSQVQIFRESEHRQPWQ